jgi:murein DD-endopeptidase MepM/ murein hydrolase activator NlpD
MSQSFGHLGHVGTDYKAPVGTKVYSVMDGIVIRDENYGRVYGRYLMILHCDGYLSLYAHLSEFKVKFGQVVESGDLIALSGGDPNDKIDGDGWSMRICILKSNRIFDNNLYNIDLKYLG